jgi:hypothetical protein
MTCAADGDPKVSLFYQRLETTPNKDEEIRLFVEKILQSPDFTHPVIGFPDVHGTGNLVRAVRDIRPDRPGLESSVSHLEITPMTTSLSTRQPIAQ